MVCRTLAEMGDDVDNGRNKRVGEVDFDEIEKQWLNELGCEDGDDDKTDDEYIGEDNGEDNEVAQGESIVQRLTKISRILKIRFCTHYPKFASLHTLGKKKFGDFKISKLGYTSL